MTTVDFYIGLAALILVLEATRRTVGLPISVIAGFMPFMVPSCQVLLPIAAIAAFIIQYMFVLSPELLMIDTTIVYFVWVVCTSLGGMMIIGAGIIGFWFRKLYLWERFLGIVGG